MVDDTHAERGPPAVGGSSNELPKTFDPAGIEARWYAHWEENGLFRPASTPDRPRAEPFTIVNPPPNVTGSLHIGHALDNTLQDIVIRYERLRGKDALWVVGMDHAGIATQMVVERQMAEQQDRRTNYSREEFVKKVWEWKEESGGTITGQLRRLGCSMDWSNERFTMDPAFVKAVLKVFVDMFKKGLIYRDKRLVNWDPGLKTAISDLEVETLEVQGRFWHFNYPLADGSGTISVATTRPETMLADMAVAVHPDDERYAALVESGAKVRLPITGREIPIVADEHADPELGSGAVKITPGHDFNDFEVGKRAGIAPADMLNMLDADAKVVQCGGIPDDLLGLDRFEARTRVVEMLKASGHLVPHVDKDGAEHDAEPRTIQTPYGDRSNVIIEPWLTDQWYVDAETLARPAIAAVKSGAIEIVPKTWEKTYFNWMENIQPWCISRQLWWGHRIPAWYGPVLTETGTSFDLSDYAKNKVFVAENEDEIREQAQRFYGESKQIELSCDPHAPLKRAQFFLDGGKADGSVLIVQDSNVLDTWFSSALWPFGTLGWPDETDDLARHYPNNLLISGFDILFFWDARMIMQGIEQMGENPWPKLYLHGLVRAADGSKMSKSKGNVVDPLGLIDRFGADALRFFMAAMESQGRDIKMDESRVEGYRNFATKLWNAARFCQSNGIGASATVKAPQAKLAVNKWIIGEVVETQAALDTAMAELRFDAAASTIYHFVWDRFCDWYIELVKGNFDEETRKVAGWVLDQILVMLHPFMPFVTEELWHALGTRKYELIVAQWPAPEAEVDAAAKAEIEWVIALTRDIRAAKNELGIAPGARLNAYVDTPSEALTTRIARQSSALEKVTRLDSIEAGTAPEGASMQLVVEGVTYVIPLGDVIDIDAEKARLAKAKAAVEKERDSLAKRLGNPSFVEKAAPQAVEKARADHADKSAEAERLDAALARLG